MALSVTKQRNLSQLIVFAMLYGGSNMFKLGAVEPEEGTKEETPPVQDVQQEQQQPSPAEGDGDTGHTADPVSNAPEDTPAQETEQAPSILPDEEDEEPDPDLGEEDGFPEELTFPEKDDEDEPVL